MFADFLGDSRQLDFHVCFSIPTVKYVVFVEVYEENLSLETCSWECKKYFNN